MENKVLPAVRVPTIPAGDPSDDGSVSETPIVDLPPSEKFGFAYPDRPMITPILPPNAQRAAPEADSSEHDETSESESQDESSTPPATGGRDSADRTPSNEIPDSHTTPVLSPSPPRLLRAFSTPLTAQLGHLNNPHRTPALTGPRDAYFVPPSPLALAKSPNSTRLQELSVELADSVQMVIQTLLQIAPPHLLDPAKEQFSACSLSVPSPSVTAMLTAMKNLNYMSANMTAFSDDLNRPPGLTTLEQNSLTAISISQDDFDVGEMLQSVGDALSGVAAQAGVELVLYHADVGMKHVSVRGDECGVSYALSHIVRQILDTAQFGDTLEIGLSIVLEIADSREQSQGYQSSDVGSRSSSRASSSPDYDGPLRCTFEIGHKFGASDAAVVMENNPHVTAATSLFRPKPRLDSMLFRRLLQRIGGSITEELQPRLFSPGRSCELSVVFEPGSAELLSQRPTLSPEEQAFRQPYASMNIQLASEPSLEELLQFVDTLKGKKVVLHASAKGSFAHHLSSYLTAWGLDVSHKTMAASEDEISDTVSAGTGGSAEENLRRISPTVMMTDSPGAMEINPVEEQFREKSADSITAFIIIDDDTDALRDRLMQLRSDSAFNLSLRQRPKLAAHHRPKSSPQIYRAKGIKFTPQQSISHPVIIHFTSLQNYKLVKDVIHTILSTPNSSSFIPEVIVLPKPAGPRRVLTALRTAVIKPIVDPSFSPIATSPMSPNGQGVNPFSPFGSSTSPSQKSNRPAISPRTGSERSSRSSKEVVELHPRLPPSPLRESDSLEYFSEAAEKLGTSPSSGLVIQSPDGQPAGIFFHPRGAGTRPRTDAAVGPTVVSPPNLIRDAGNLRPPGEHRRTSLQRRVSTATHDGDMSPGERPKSSSRPKGTGRDRSYLYFSDAGSAPPSDGETPIHSPGHRWTYQPISPHGELPIPPEITNTEPTPPIHTVSTDGGLLTSRASPGVASDRKSMSPPTSPALHRPGAGTKRGYNRKATAESPGAVLKKGKQSADGNIVPPINVLIVEDNPINQTILSTFMKKKKIKYDVAKNGAEAVTKWKTGSFHLILMDIQMPVMDGIEATLEIRRLERQVLGVTFVSTPPLDGEQTPSSDATSSESKSTLSMHTPFRSSVIIVALTASSLPTDRVAALAAGCNDFLTKPVSLLWLNNKIIEWGSIKALQMWADLRPEVVKNLASGQANQAQAVASNLHMPEFRQKRSPPSSHESPRAAPSPIDAMRMLSSPTRIPFLRATEHVDSDHSDTENRTAAFSSVDSRAPNTPLVGTESDSSRPASVPADTPPEEKEKLLPPAAHTQVSGEEALRVHIKDSTETASSLAERQASGRPIVLGERSISGLSASIEGLLLGEQHDTDHIAIEGSVAGTPEREIRPDASKSPATLPPSSLDIEDKDDTPKGRPQPDDQ